MTFTTYDRDNDPMTNSNPAYKNNCAVSFGNRFRHKTCVLCHINGAREHFHWFHNRLQISRMWLTC